MRRRPAVIILMLIIAVILPLPVWAQQKIVAPGFSPARAYVAASSPRHGGVRPTLRHTDPSASSGQALGCAVAHRNSVAIWREE